MGYKSISILGLQAPGLPTSSPSSAHFPSPCDPADLDGLVRASSFSSKSKYTNNTFHWALE